MKKTVLALVFMLFILNANAQVCGNGECEPGELYECEADCASVKVQIEGMKQNQNTLLIFIIVGTVASGVVLVVDFLMKRKKKGVGEVEDFIKRKQQKELVKPQQAKTYDCPQCGGKLTWIPKYKRWYCYKCKKYF